MTEIQERAVEALREQQGKVKPNSAPCVVALQLMDICRAEPESAELILQDLANKDMSITAAEKKIEAYADAHKEGGFAFVPPAEADRILRAFYGLPAAGAEQPRREPEKAGGFLDLMDFLG